MLEAPRPFIVFDTNVLVTGMLFPHSVPAQALRVARSTCTLLASQATLDELTDVISRDKFDRYLSIQERVAIIRQISLESNLIEVKTIVRVCRDAQDDKFLSLAVAGRTSLLITGDQDLLILHPFQSITILTPMDFLKL